MSTYTTPLKNSRSIATIGKTTREQTDKTQNSQPTNSNYTEAAAKLRLSSTAKSSLDRSAYIANDPNAISGCEGEHAQAISKLQDSFNATLSSAAATDIHVGANKKDRLNNPLVSVQQH